MSPDQQNLIETLDRFNTSGFFATNFLLYEYKDDKHYFEMIHAYECERGCTDQEDIFDLHDKSGIIRVLNRYDIETLRGMITTGWRYFFDGENFEEPVCCPSLFDAVNALLDEEFITAIFDNESDNITPYWADLFDIPDLKKWLYDNGYIHQSEEEALRTAAEEYVEKNSPVASCYTLVDIMFDAFKAGAKWMDDCYKNGNGN